MAAAKSARAAKRGKKALAVGTGADHSDISPSVSSTDSTPQQPPLKEIQDGLAQPQRKHAAAKRKSASADGESGVAGDIADSSEPGGKGRVRKSPRSKAAAVECKASETELGPAREPSILVKTKGKDSSKPNSRKRKMAPIFMNKEQKAEAAKHAREEQAKTNLRAKIETVKQWDSLMQRDWVKDGAERKVLKLVSQANLTEVRDWSHRATPAPYPSADQTHCRQQDTFDSSKECVVEMPVTLKVVPAEASPGLLSSANAGDFIRGLIQKEPVINPPVEAAGCQRLSASVEDARLKKDATELYERHYLPRGISSRGGAAAAQLWTEVYKPTSHLDVIGNRVAVATLRDWLSSWKAAQSAHLGGKDSQSSQDTESALDASCSECESSVDSDDDFKIADHSRPQRTNSTSYTNCNTTLVAGPVGSCKTAAILACAEELGYQVLELHAGQSRTGRNILSMLSEATQSHQVASKGGDSVRDSSEAFATFDRELRVKKSAFQDGIIYTTVLDNETPKEIAATLQCDVKDLVRQNQKRYPGIRQKSKLKIGTALIYSPMETNAPEAAQKVAAMQAEALASATTGDNTAPSNDCASGEKDSPGGLVLAEASLILIEDVDLVFQSDTGFWSAIDKLMSTSKKPIIMTSSASASEQPSFRNRFQKLHFRRPSAASVHQHMRLLCCAEGLSLSDVELQKLIAHTDRDVRAIISQLQVWSLRSSHPNAPSPLDTFIGTGTMHVSVAERKRIIQCRLSACDISAGTDTLSSDGDADDNNDSLTAQRVVEMDAMSSMLDSLSFSDQVWHGSTGGSRDLPESQYDSWSHADIDLAAEIAKVTISCSSDALANSAEMNVASVRNQLEDVGEHEAIEADFWKERHGIAGTNDSAVAATDKSESSVQTDLTTVPEMRSFYNDLPIVCQAQALSCFEPVSLLKLATRNQMTLLKAARPILPLECRLERWSICTDILPALRCMGVASELTKGSSRKYMHYFERLGLPRKFIAVLSDGVGSRGRQYLEHPFLLHCRNRQAKPPTIDHGVTAQ